MRRTLVVLALIAAAPAPARACDDKLQLPLLVLGMGLATDGNGPDVQVGYGRGERDDCHDSNTGYTMSRMLVGFRFAEQMKTSLTYGWYENIAGSVGFDFGLEGDRNGGGPILRLTIGTAGFALRASGGLRFADQTGLFGVLEAVVDVTDLVDQIRRD